MGMHLVHSGPVVTHRSASGAQPAGQQVCANAGDISAYAKTRITSFRYPMPFPSLTTIWGGKLVLAPSRPGTIDGDRSDLRIYQTPSTNRIQGKGARIVPSRLVARFNKFERI